MVYGKVTKLARLSKPLHSEYMVPTDYFIHGCFDEFPPKVGKRCMVWNNVRDWLHTSEITSMLIIGSDTRDKLVLPDSFPDRATLILPEDMQEGDILFSTLNSVYYISNILEVK